LVELVNLLVGPSRLCHEGHLHVGDGAPRAAELGGELPGLARVKETADRNVVLRLDVPGGVAVREQQQPQEVARVLDPGSGVAGVCCAAEQRRVRADAGHAVPVRATPQRYMGSRRGRGVGSIFFSAFRSHFQHPIFRNRVPL